MTIFLAGHETTALGLSFWAWLLAENPSAMLHAQNEVDRVLAGQPSSYEQVAGLRCLSWSLKEALRLYPPASSLIGRRTLREVEIGEWRITKSAIVRITPWEMHRDARWLPEPARFAPERFDESTPLINRHSFMAFGTGPRACITTHFDLTEMTLIAAYLLQRFSFQSASRPKPKLEVLLIPEGGIALQLIRRSKAGNPSLWTILLT